MLRTESEGFGAIIIATYTHDVALRDAAKDASRRVKVDTAKWRSKTSRDQRK